MCFFISVIVSSLSLLQLQGGLQRSGSLAFLCVCVCVRACVRACVRGEGGGGVPKHPCFLSITLQCLYLSHLNNGSEVYNLSYREVPKLFFILGG